MEKDRNIERQEKLFDAVLKVALDEYIESEMESYPSKEELDKMYPRSAAFDKRVNKIIAKEERIVKRKKAIRIFTRVAACIGIFFFICSVVLMSVEASRNFILNAIISIQDDHVAFEFYCDGSHEGGVSVPPAFFNDFILLSSQTIGDLAISIYENPEGSRIIIQQHIGINLGAIIDNDYREFSTMVINGHSAYIFESIDGAEHNIIMWYQINTVFQIISDIEFSELIRMAEYLIS